MVGVAKLGVANTVNSGVVTMSVTQSALSIQTLKF